jgi:hypothetical protein
LGRCAKSGAIDRAQPNLPSICVFRTDFVSSYYEKNFKGNFMDLENFIKRLERGNRGSEIRGIEESGCHILPAFIKANLRL